MFEPDFDKSSDGLIPVIVQDSTDNRVLMLAYVNREAWQRSLTTKTATYWSRSRQKLWVKGETSGNTQIINDILIDCDQDTVIFKVTQQGTGACHTGHRSCFYRRIKDNGKVEEVEC